MNDKNQTHPLKASYDQVFSIVQIRIHVEDQ